MQKFIKSYRSFNEMDCDDRKFWKKASMDEREVVRDALLENYCLFKGIDLNVRKFTRILRTVKYPQS